MIVDFRRYTIKPGQLKYYLSLYETYGLPTQRRHIGEPLAYFVSEVGTLNQVLHIWGYRDFDDRKQRRGCLEADPDWIEYKKMTSKGGLIQLQENELLIPTAWSQIK